jgi:cysteine desulfurase / selenocysteine lyase
MTKLEMNSKNFLETDSFFEKSNIAYFDSAEKNLIPVHIKNQYLEPDQDIDWVREQVRKLINADKAREVIFTSGNSHSMMLVASYLKNTWRPKDVLIIPESEYAVNFKIWKDLSLEIGCAFETINVIKDGSLDIAHLEEIMAETEGKIFFSMSHISATTGFVQPVEDVFSLVKKYDGITLLDATHSINHEPIDVNKNLIDWLIFPSNNMYNYSGIGVLYAKQRYLEKINALFTETFDELLLPEKLESKYKNINGIVSLGKSIEWISNIGLENIKSKYLLMNANLQMMLENLDFVEVFHPNFYKGGIISFRIKNVHALDIKEHLSKNNVVLSAGFLDSAYLVEQKFTEGIVRLSWGLNNTKQDVETVRNALLTFNK